MFTLVGSAYLSGVVSGVSKKITSVLTRNMFTPKEHKFAETTVGKFYSCRPIDAVFSKEEVNKLQTMVETDNFRGMLKLARDEVAILDKPCFVSDVIGVLNSFTMFLTSIIHKATTAYI